MTKKFYALVIQTHGDTSQALGMKTPSHANATMQQIDGLRDLSLH